MSEKQRVSYCRQDCKHGCQPESVASVGQLLDLSVHGILSAIDIITSETHKIIPSPLARGLEVDSDIKTMISREHVIVRG